MSSVLSFLSIKKAKPYVVTVFHPVPHTDKYGLLRVKRCKDSENKPTFCLQPLLKTKSRSLMTKTAAAKKRREGDKPLPS